MSATSTEIPQNSVIDLTAQQRGADLAGLFELCLCAICSRPDERPQFIARNEKELALPRENLPIRHRRIRSPRK